MQNVLFLTDLQKNQILDIRKTKEAVVWLYTNYTDTVHSDTVLWFYYLQVFHNITPEKSYGFVHKYLMKNKVRFEVVSRAGRKLRQLYRGRFKRDEKITAEIEGAFRQEFGRGEY